MDGLIVESAVRTVQSVRHVMRRRLLLLSIVGPALAVVSVQTPAVTAQLVVASFATHHRRRRSTGLLLLVQGARDVTDDVTVARPRLVAVAAGGSDRWTIIRVSKQS